MKLCDENAGGFKRVGDACWMLCGRGIMSNCCVLRIEPEPEPRPSLGGRPLQEDREVELRERAGRSLDPSKSEEISILKALEGFSVSVNNGLAKDA